MKNNEPRRADLVISCRSRVQRHEQPGQLPIVFRVERLVDGFDIRRERVAYVGCTCTAAPSTIFAAIAV